MCACAWRWRDERARRCARWHLPTPAPHVVVARASRADHGAGASTRPGSSVRPFVPGGCARHPPPPPPLRPAPRRRPPPRPPPPRRRSRSGTRWRWSARRSRSGGGGVSPRVRVRAAVRPSHARGDRRGARDGRQGWRPLRGSRQGPDLGPVAARRGVPVPALRGMRRVHVAGRIVRRAAGHEARAGAGRVAPNRKGFAAKRRLGGRFVGAMEKGRERALPARRVRARRPRPADAPRAVHGEVQEQDGVRFRGESPPRKRRERSRRAPRPAPAGRPRHRRRGHLPRRRRPRLPPAAPRGERRARKCTGAPADARGRGRGAPGVRPTDGRGRAEERHRARVESRKSGERSSFERASSRQV